MYCVWQVMEDAGDTDWEMRNRMEEETRTLLEVVIKRLGKGG